MSERMEEVLAEMRTLERSRTSARAEITLGTPGITSEEILAGLQGQSAEMLKEMQAIGEKLGFSFATTDLLTAQELSNDDITPVGTAQDFNSGRTVMQDAFSMFPDERDPYADTNLFDSRRAVKNQFDLEADESHFVWLITAFSPSHIPELEDPGIREEIILALRREKARELVKKRGEELVELIRKGVDPQAEEPPEVSDLVADQTVLGDADSAAIVVRGTQLFSWFEEELPAQMNFQQQQPTLRLSSVYFADGAGETIRYAGNEFMKSVFEELEAGEVAVVPDELLRSYYVAYVSDRIADEAIMRQMFLQAGSSPTGFRSGSLSQLLSAEVRQPAMVGWTRSLWMAYGITPDSE